MKGNNKILIVIIVAVLLVGIAGTFVVFTRSKGSEQVVTNPAAVEEALVTDSEKLTIEVQEAADPTQSEVVDEQIIPTPRSGLESTNPATVNLTSGEIQLVEVFAFW